MQVQHEGAFAAHSTVSCPHCWVKWLRVTYAWSAPFQLLLLERRAMEEDMQCIPSHQAGLHTRCWKPLDQNSPLSPLTIKLPFSGFS